MGLAMQSGLPIDYPSLLEEPSGQQPQRSGRSSVSTIVPSTIAVVPCLDEASTIHHVVSGLKGRVRSVVVVDDGSTDGTSAVARRSGAEVLRNERTLGKGAAMAAGWTRALELGAEWCLFLDGDGQHDPAEADQFRQPAERGARLVIGNRMTQPGMMPGVRRFTNRWVSRRVSELAGCRVPDALCGYRLVHLPSLQRLQLTSRRYEIESDMTVAFGRSGFPIASVPIHSRYLAERSKISPLWDTLRWFRWYYRARRG
jgi:glycosyltransferase involved in cell wall biosynthesis